MIVAMAIGLALAIQAVVVKPYQIPSGSMKPTLDIGQRVLVNRFTYELGADPNVGDILVFHPPAGADDGGRKCGVDRAQREPCSMPTEERSEDNFIKRVIAGPGDRLRIVNGNPVVNGDPVDQSGWTINPCHGGIGTCDFPEEVTVPDDHYFMMGDNRGGSDDSRYWGPVPREWIIGEAFFTYWPPKRIGLF